MNMMIKRLAATLAAASVLSPAIAMAGTRAATAVPASKASSPAQGPKNGFPASPGLEIAKIKANGNAAFKRKSAGT